MSTRIRLKRKGRRKQTHFRIVVVDKRRPRDGAIIEDLGYYNPLTEPADIKIDKEKALDWLQKGAQPSDTVHNIMQKEGIALEYHLIKNNVDEETRNIEMQKWELANKAKAEKKKKEKTEKEEQKQAKAKEQEEAKEAAAEQQKEEKADKEETEEEVDKAEAEQESKEKEAAATSEEEEEKPSKEEEQDSAKKDEEASDKDTEKE